MTDTTPWTFPQLLDQMLAAGWQVVDDKWEHPDGATVDLHRRMLDKRPYWYQLAERHKTPPTTDPPF